MSTPSLLHASLFLVRQLFGIAYPAPCRPRSRSRTGKTTMNAAVTVAGLDGPVLGLLLMGGVGALFQIAAWIVPGFWAVGVGFVGFAIVLGLFGGVATGLGDLGIGDGVGGGLVLQSSKRLLWRVLLGVPGGVAKGLVVCVAALLLALVFVLLVIAPIVGLREGARTEIVKRNGYYVRRKEERERERRLGARCLASSMPIYAVLVAVPLALTCVLNISMLLTIRFLDPDEVVTNAQLDALKTRATSQNTTMLQACMCHAGRGLQCEQTPPVLASCISKRGQKIPTTFLLARCLTGNPKVDVDKAIDVLVHDCAIGAHGAGVAVSYGAAAVALASFAVIMQTGLLFVRWGTWSSVGFWLFAYVLLIPATVITIMCISAYTKSHLQQAYGIDEIGSAVIAVGTSPTAGVIIRVSSAALFGILLMMLIASVLDFHVVYTMRLFLSIVEGDCKVNGNGSPSIDYKGEASTPDRFVTACTVKKPPKDDVEMSCQWTDEQSYNHSASNSRADALR